MSDWNVSDAFITMTSVKMVIFSAFFFYLYFRKRIRTFISLACALMLSSFIIIGAGQIQYYIKVMIIILILLVSLFINHKEISLLTAGGHSTRDILKPDKIDLFVAILLIIVWATARRLLLN
jgi:hypothetical protein